MSRHASFSPLFRGIMSSAKRSISFSVSASSFLSLSCVMALGSLAAKGKLAGV